MPKTILGILVAITVVAGGWYLYSQRDAGTVGESMNASPSGSQKPDTRLVVGESIMGQWQDTTDQKFVREFKDFMEGSLSGTVADWYEGKQVSSGTYQVYTKENPAAVVGFPLEDNAVYLQLVMSGTQADTLNFKVTASPEADQLQLIYMDRGGVLSFKKVPSSN